MGTAAQWGPQQVRAEQAWATSTGRGAVIVVVDSGVDLGHPDLKGKLVRGATFVDGSTCLTVEGRTCAWMYGSSGSVSDVRTALDPGAAPITELISVNAEDGGSPEAPRLLSYASHLAAPDNRTRFVHSVEFPQAGSASVMLSGGETNAEPTCGPDNGSFSTFTVKSGTVKSGHSTAPTFTYADTFKLREGDYTDGNTPAGGYKLGCSAHWFEQHPIFRDGGLVALSAYKSGTKFPGVTKEGQITERGFFLPLDSSASAPHWAPDGRTLHVTTTCAASTS